MTETEREIIFAAFALFAAQQTLDEGAKAGLRKQQAAYLRLLVAVESHVVTYGQHFRRCLVCKNWFSKRTDARFCSSRCRNAFHHARRKAAR